MGKGTQRDQQGPGGGVWIGREGGGGGGESEQKEGGISQMDMFECLGGEMPVGANGERDAQGLANAGRGGGWGGGGWTGRWPHTRVLLSPKSCMRFHITQEILL